VAHGEIQKYYHVHSDRAKMVEPWGVLSPSEELSDPATYQIHPSFASTPLEGRKNQMSLPSIANSSKSKESLEAGVSPPTRKLLVDQQQRELLTKT
jgi:hypothetical protein